MTIIHSVIEKEILLNVFQSLPKVQTCMRFVPRSTACIRGGLQECVGLISMLLRLRPYHREHTGSRPITEVKPGRAGLVLGWVTAWEYPVL